jgi:hypothetical protein
MRAGRGHQRAVPAKVLAWISVIAAVAVRCSRTRSSEIRLAGHGDRIAGDRDAIGGIYPFSSALRRQAEPAEGNSYISRSIDATGQRSG